MDKTCNLLYKFCRVAITVIACAIALAVFFLNFIYNATVAYDRSEKVTFSGHIWQSLIMLALAAIVVLAICFFKDRLPKINLGEKKLFIILSAVYTFFALYLILNVESVLRADPRSVFNAALNFSEGDYKDFEVGGYIYRYPHQIGLLTFERILLVFSKNPAVSFVANFLLVLGINFYTYKISDLLFENRTVNLLTLLCSFAFLPQLFFIMFAYGVIPGLFAMVAAFYFALKFKKTHSILSLVLMSVFAALAVIFKMNFLIGVIAIVLYILVETLRERKWINLVAICVLILCMILPGKALTAYYEGKTGAELDNGVPTVLWIAMGTDLDNRVRAPGWYDNSNYSIYAKSDFDSELAAEKGREKLLANIEKIKADPAGAAAFFTEKAVSQWCEPLYQSVWSGPLEFCGQDTHTELLQSLYSGESETHNLLGAYAKLLTLMLWALSVIFLIFYSRKNQGFEMIFMFVIGGFLFHTVWEGKSQYIYPYVFVLIPFAMYALYCVCKLDIKKIFNKRERAEADASEQGE